MKTKLIWAKIFATVGGAGLLPVAPGTWGSAVAALFLLPFLGKSGMEMLPYLLVGSLFFTWLGAYFAKKLEPEWGDDPKRFVLDELVGMWITLIGLPLNMTNLIVGFFLFRLFDIFKPLGIRRLESVPNGWGVMLDDVGAGIAANILLWALHFYQIK